MIQAQRSATLVGIDRDAWAADGPWMSGRPGLPIDEILGDVVAALRQGPAVVVQAPPGAGKTTRLPPALLAAGLVGNGKLLLLEPRRIAARAAALTMARQHGETVGRTFGYQVRFEKRESAATQVLVVTEGILTRRFGSDPFLEGISVVVLDEFHERSVHTDLCLALLAELMSVRDDLKVVVMSATLDAGAVSRFLGDCPVVTSLGRPHPVSIRHIDKKPRDDERPLQDRVAGAIRNLMAAADDDGGDVLCFLPGAPEIRRLQERLLQDPLPDPQGRGVDVVPLFGSLSSAEQDRALFRPAGAAGPRRIVLATNVAETSLTIDGVTSVVDTGLMKSVRYDPRADREQLELVKISQASAEQRAGRAGRTRPGRALRLWTLAEHQQLPTSHPPEIHRTELSGVLLDVALFTNNDPRTFRFFEPPPKAHVEQALALLRLLGALDVDNKPTPRGRELARLPLSPRAAAVLVAAAREDIVDDAALAVALLQDDRALSQLQPRGQPVRTDSDLQVVLERAYDDSRLREVHASAKELQRLVSHQASGPAGSGSPALRLKRALLAGFPDRLCRRRRLGEADALMVGNRGVRLATESGVLDASLFLALSLQGQGASSLVRMAEAIEPEVLAQVLPQALSSNDEAVLDEERGAFIGVRRIRFADLIISEKSGVPVLDDALALGLAQAFAERFERLFRLDDDAINLRARIRFAQQVMPQESWPDVADDALKALLPDLCRTLVSKGKRKLDDVASAPWLNVLLDMLSWPQLQLLNKEVPDKIEVPTGNRLAVDYRAAANDGSAPVLAVRLQELFGLLDTPRIAQGKIGVVLHLLSPGYKPVQVTRDLRSFWKVGYVDVKKELKARYPKHSWPDDPLTAPPVAKGRPQRG